MFNDDFSTQPRQPKPAREIALHVRSLEHHLAVSSIRQPEAGWAAALKTLPRRVRLLLASL